MRRAGWLLVALFVLTTPLVNPYIRGDGNGYYAYIRSLVIDGDLQFEDEYRRGDPAFVATVIGPDGRVSPGLVTGTGHLRNQWAVGPSILWAPPFLLAHAVARISGRLGHQVPIDGYSVPYRWLCALATAAYAFLGLALAWAAASRVVTPATAAAATIGIWFASPLPVYMYFLPFHAPALSAFTVSLFLWYWLRTRDARTPAQWATWGLAAGLMVEVYYINGVCLLIPALELGRAMVRRRREGARALGGVWAGGLVFGVAAGLALVPHVIVKAIIHGSPFRTGYDDHFFWSSPRLWHVAFASEHGMFLWTPVLLLATLGLAWLWGRDRWLTANLALVLAAYYYVVASYENWHGQSAYGNRFLVSLTPVFVLGLSGFLVGASAVPIIARWRSLAGALLLGGLILWNVGLMYQWGTGLVPNRGPADFALVARNQVTEVPSRMVGFLTRYLTGREQVTRELEERDLERVRGYSPRR